MVERADAVLAAVPVLLLAGPAVTASARLLESVAGVGGGVAALPLAPAGLVAALLVVIAAMAWPPRGNADS